MLGAVGVFACWAAQRFVFVVAASLCTGLGVSSMLSSSFLKYWSTWLIVSSLLSLLGCGEALVSIVSLLVLPFPSLGVISGVSG